MKTYNEEYRKSWSIELQDFVDGFCTVAAVDSQTGYFIVELIRFAPDGTVYTPSKSEQILASCGYDPGEHGNTWTDDGRLVISTEN